MIVSLGGMIIGNKMYRLIFLNVNIVVLINRGKFCLLKSVIFVILFLDRIEILLLLM